MKNSKFFMILFYFSIILPSVVFGAASRVDSPGAAVVCPDFSEERMSGMDNKGLHDLAYSLLLQDRLLSAANEVFENVRRWHVMHSRQKALFPRATDFSDSRERSGFEFGGVFCLASSIYEVWECMKLSEGDVVEFAIDLRSKSMAVGKIKSEYLNSGSPIRIKVGRFLLYREVKREITLSKVIPAQDRMKELVDGIKCMIGSEFFPPPNTEITIRPCETFIERFVSCARRGVSSSNLANKEFLVEVVGPLGHLCREYMAGRAHYADLYAKLRRLLLVRRKREGGDIKIFRYIYLLICSFIFCCIKILFNSSKIMRSSFCFD